MKNVRPPLVMFLFLLCFSSMRVWAADLVLTGDLASQTYVSAGNIITSGACTVAPGVDVGFKASGIRLMPGFSVKRGARFTAQAVDFSSDTTPPEIISNYPEDGSHVCLNGSGNVEFRATVLDDFSEVTSIRLLDGDGVDITDRAVINGNTIIYLMENPESKTHRLTVVAEDVNGNSASTEIVFTVDSVVPVTTPAIAGGEFDHPVSVQLACSETEAKIYYSTDGYPPYKGAANTTEAGSSAVVSVDKTTKLQFFAIDKAGNREATRSEIYIIGKPSLIALDLLAPVYDSASGTIRLSWEEPAEASMIRGYYVYRSINPVETEILGAGHGGHYPPPSRLRVSEELTGLSYQDSDIYPGSNTYWYGVTAVTQKGAESPISVLRSVDVNQATAAQTVEQSVRAAEAWLTVNQNSDGSWGSDERSVMPSTAQVLQALKRKNLDNAWIRKGLFYLRGHAAPNNDFLSRKILTLHGYGQNCDELVNRLVSWCSK